jgi:hypothetical protein
VKRLIFGARVFVNAQTVWIENLKEFHAVTDLEASTKKRRGAALLQRSQRIF